MISGYIPDDGDYNRRTDSQKRDYMHKINSMRSQCGLPELSYKTGVRLEFYTGKESDVDSLSDKAKRKLNKMYWNFFDRHNIKDKEELKRFQIARIAKVKALLNEGKDEKFILEGEEEDYFIFV